MDWTGGIDMNFATEENDMELTIPSYKELFEVTQDRLRRLRQKAIKQSGTLDACDEFMFQIVGNINLRFNSMCLLIENNNWDGLFAFQRTLFELQLAFEVYMNSEDKNKLVELYKKKGNFEIAFKWNKYISAIDINEVPKFPKEYGKWVSDWQSNTTQALKQSTKNRTTDTWYEQATNRSTKDLSYEYLSELDYYISYDEPSNWIHPQSLEENLDMNFNQRLEEKNLCMLSIMVKRDLQWLMNNIYRIQKYLKIEKSVKIAEYFNKICLFNDQMQSFLNEMLNER